jgi:hypothetical protein
MLLFTIHLKFICIELALRKKKTSRKMLRKEKTVFAVALSGMDRGDVAAATESWRLDRRASPAGR